MNDSGVVDRFSVGGHMMINENHGVSGSMGLRSMVVPNTLGPETGMPATIAELQSYMQFLRSTLETKYTQWRQAFQSIDSDRSGQISEEEIVAACTQFGFPIPPSHLKEIFAGMDADGSGLVDFNEFAKAMEKENDKWIRSEERRLREMIQNK